MKFRVGDKVRIRRLESVQRYYMGDAGRRKYPRYPTVEMCNMAQQVVTIALVSCNGYTIEGLPDYLWTDEMFEPTFEIGDKVKCIFHPHPPYCRQTGVVVEIAEDYGNCPVVKLDNSHRKVSYLPCNVELIRDDPPKYRITITSDGVQSVATIFKDNKKLETIASKASKIDELEFIEYAKRALNELAEKRNNKINNK